MSAQQLLSMFVFKLYMMMNDELSGCHQSYSDKKGDFSIKMHLQSIDHQTVLVIELKNQAKMDFFVLHINKDFLSQNADLAFCFETPQELLYTLVQLFKDVNISEDGLMTFEMKLNASKLKKKVFKIQIQKQNIDKTQMMLLKLQSLKKQFKLQAAAKDELIQQQSQKIRELEQTAELLREQVSEMKKQAEELSLEYKKKDFKINNIIKESDLQRQEIGILRKSLQQIHKKLNFLQLYNFFDNPHWHYFRVYHGDQSIIVIKKDNDNIWHSFIRNVPLSAGKIYQFKIKQLKTYYKNVMMGIITRQSFGVAYAYKEKTCLSYNSYNGNIWENSNSRKGGSSIRDGQIVSIQINLIDFRIMWLLQGKKIGQALISEQFRNKEIFLCLQLYNIQDQLQLMLY